MTILRLVLQLCLDLLHLDLEIFLGQFKVFLLSLHIDLLLVDSFLKSTHRSEELGGQLDQGLAITNPVVIKDSCLTDCDSFIDPLDAHLILLLKLHGQFSIGSFPLCYCLLFRVELKLLVLNLGHKLGVFLAQVLQFVLQFLQIEKAVLFRVSQLHP